MAPLIPESLEVQSNTQVVVRQPSLIGHLARETRESMRTQGLTSAAQEIVTMECFLRAFRGHLLTKPLDARPESFNTGVMMIELMIMREARRKHP